MTSHAWQSLDLLGRQYSERAIESPTPVRETMLWAGTSLGIAGVPLLVGHGELEEVVETPPVTAIPGTKAWVMGVGSHMGGLLPIISGDVFFRQRPYAGRIRDFCLVIRRPGFYFGITLSDVEQDMKFPLERCDMNHPVDADFARFTRGGFQHEGRFLAILDIDKLVADSDLSDAAALGLNSNEDNSDDQEK